MNKCEKHDYQQIEQYKSEMMDLSFSTLKSSDSYPVMIVKSKCKKCNKIRTESKRLKN